MARARTAARAVAALSLIALSPWLPPRPAGAQTDSLTVVPGERYRASSELHEALLGRRYRELWTTPIRVPVLDLRRFAGGLVPVERGGHKQTRSLRFRGSDGREYNFRSVDKDVTQGLPEFLRETTADHVLQDLTSAQLPAAAVVATGLLDAAGVLNPAPALFVLPDDPALGEFRAEFAGMLGSLEVHANEGEGGEPLFAGSPRVAGTERMLEHLEESPGDRVDARAFLRARLVDVLVGDFDRHADQWRWARFDRGGLRWWVPVPEDRDYAFVDYDGLLLSLLRGSVAPRLVRFRDRYPNPLALLSNSMPLDRRLLAELPREAWDSAAADLQRALPDSVIRAAVERMPPEHAGRVGPELVRELIARRDLLPEIARDLYGVLAQNVEVHATDEADRAEVERTPGGGLEVRLFAQETGDVPYFRRAFLPGETEEVRLFLHGGDDRATISGARGGIVVRLIGGGGDDFLEDRADGPAVFYDSRGDNRFEPGARTRVSRAEPREPEDSGGAILPSLSRDWGARSALFIPAADWRPHAELVVGGGPSWTRFAFRHRPYGWRIRARGWYAPLHGRIGVEAEGDFRREDSPRAVSLRASATGLDATAFYGLGNQSPLRPEEEARVWHRRYRLDGRLHLPLGRWGEAAVGGVVQHTDPTPPPGSPLALRPDLGGPLGQVGTVLELRGGDPVAAGRVLPGAGFKAEGALFRGLEGARGDHGRLSATATAGLEVPGAAGVVLVGRAGGSAALGDFAFFDAAFLGGWDSLRGYRFQRFAGDRAVFGGAELQIPLSRLELLVRGELGLSLFADAGRVYLDGASPGGWHTAAGTSLWFATPIGSLVASYALGEEDRLYLRLAPGDRTP